MYRITYLPIARQDITDISDYIAHQLKAPQASLHLLDTLEHSISVLAEFPYAHRVYRTVKPLAEEYRMLPVKNFAVFYTVFEQERIVEIRRILYAKADLVKYLCK